MKHKITFLIIAVFTSMLSAQTVSIEGGSSYASISAAIAAASDGDVIDITGTHTESIDISKAITLRGTDPSTDIIQAAATQGAATSRVIVASGDKNITIENLTVQNGNSADHGGGIFADKVTGLLTLDNVIITNNTTAKNGGGISTGGSNVNFNDCTISNNSTTANGTGGGIHIVPNNGAAIDAVVNVKNSVIHNNTTLKTGGGFVINGNHQYGDKYTITANFENVTIFSNTAGPNGGAGYVVGVDFVAGGSGSVTTGATNTNLNMVHCTVAYNTITASDNGKQGLTFTNANASTGPNFNIYNSIVVSADDNTKKALNFANSNANDVINNILGGLNAFSPVQDLNNQKGKTATFAGLTNALSDEGGNTQVLAIAENSNSDDHCTAATGITLPTVDQIGATREGTPDAGAYEFGGGATPPPSDPTNTVSISGTSYSTIAEAIAAASDGDVIDITGTHTGSFNISKSITLRGTDPTTDIIQAAATQGAATSRVIAIYQPSSQSVNLSVENLTIKNGNTTSISDKRGGGIYVNQNYNGLLSITNCIIEENKGSEGGAIASLGCDVTITNSSIKNNTGTSNGGGLIFTVNAGNPDMQVTISKSLITGNSGTNGGGMYINGNNGNNNIDVTLENTTITDNSATTTGQYAGGGGAIWAKAANSASNIDLKLVHVTINNNTHGYTTGQGVMIRAGLVFAGGGSASTNVEIYNSIIVNGDDVTQKAMHWAKTTPVNIVNSILGGLESAAAANTFLDDAAKNNQKGKTATFAGLTGAFTEEGGNTLVLPITYNSNSDDYCTAATGITLPTVDQRGFDRGNTPDAGAYEFSFNSVWNGTTDSDWATASNWSNGVPTTGVAVRIESAANMPTASSAIDVRNMIMDAGTSFITSSTFAGNLSYTRNLSTDNWYTVSSPVVGETYGDGFVTSNGIASSGDNRAIAPYVTSNDSWAYMQAGAESATFISGKGYSVKLASPGAISFTGTMNVDDTSIALTTSGKGFNLIGNPYPSYINSGSILPNSTSALKTQTLWVWNQSTSSYDTKVTVDAFKIAPGQGFFVKSDGAEGSVLIAEADQSHQSTDTFQRTEARPEIYLTLTDGSASREAKIYFIDNTTTGFDNGYDGEMFGGVANDFAIYTHLVSNSQGKDYAIQSLPRDNYKNIPVGVNAISGTAITIEASTTNFPEGMNIYLEDTSDNSFTLLDAESDFTTTLGSDLNGIGRFYLHTTTGALSTNDVAANNNLSIYTSTRENLRIVGVQNGTANIQLYNILGKEVLKGSFEGNGVNDIALPRLNSGIYIVKIATEKGTINKKIIIQ
jgi:hypothetical protein